MAEVDALCNLTRILVERTGFPIPDWEPIPNEQFAAAVRSAKLDGDLALFGPMIYRAHRLCSELDDMYWFSDESGESKETKERVYRELQVLAEELRFYLMALRGDPEQSDRSGYLSIQVSAWELRARRRGCDGVADFQRDLQAWKLFRLLLLAGDQGRSFEQLLKSLRLETKNESALYGAKKKANSIICDTLRVTIESKDGRFKLVAIDPA